MWETFVVQKLLYVFLSNMYVHLSLWVLWNLIPDVDHVLMKALKLQYICLLCIQISEAYDNFLWSNAKQGPEL